MSEVLSVEALPGVIAELYRPADPGHWRPRILHRIRRWTGCPDAALFWTDANESAHRPGWQLRLPGRNHAPRWLMFDREPPQNVRALLDVLAPHVATAVASMERATSPAGDYPPRWRTLLTARQIQVARLVADGLSNDEVARQVGRAPRTIARLLAEIFRALEIDNRNALAAECATWRAPTPYLPAD